jgi:hypothetical protein
MDAHAESLLTDARGVKTAISPDRRTKESCRAAARKALLKRGKLF